MNVNTKDDNQHPEFDRYESNYTELVDDAVSFSGMDAGFFTRVKADYIKDFCDAHGDNHKALSALDVGCGVGNIHGFLDGFFASLTGVDVASRCVERAAKTHPQNQYLAYDGKTLPFADNHFDVVYTICVMHHVPPEQWQDFSNEMFRVLRPGGLCMVFEHNPWNPLTRHIVNTCPFDEDAVLLKTKETTKLLSGAGFNNVRSVGILSIPPTNRLLRRVDRLVSLIGLGAQYCTKAVKP